MSPQPSADLHHRKITHEQREKESASGSWELVGRTHEAQSRWVQFEIIIQTVINLRRIRFFLGFEFRFIPLTGHPLTARFICRGILSPLSERGFEVPLIFILFDNFFEGKPGLFHVDLKLKLIILTDIEPFLEPHGPAPLEVDHIVINVEIQ